MTQIHKAYVFKMNIDLKLVNFNHRSKSLNHISFIITMKKDTIYAKTCNLL